MAKDSNSVELIACQGCGQKHAPPACPPSDQQPQITVRCGGKKTTIPILQLPAWQRAQAGRSQKRN